MGTKSTPPTGKNGTLPAPDALDGEGCGVTIAADIDPARVLPYIADSIGDIFPLPEIMHLDEFRLTPGTPLAAPFL
jgi:hypothetical protein